MGPFCTREGVYTCRYITDPPCGQDGERQKHDRGHLRVGIPPRLGESGISGPSRYGFQILENAGGAWPAVADIRPGGACFAPSVANPERGAVLGAACTPVVETGGADVGVAEPVLDACDVGLVLEGVGGGRDPQRVDDAFHGNGGEGGVLPDELVDAVARERPAGPAGLGRLKQGSVPVAAVGCELEVIAQGRERGRVDRDGPGL